MNLIEAKRSKIAQTIAEAFKILKKQIYMNNNLKCGARYERCAQFEHDFTPGDRSTGEASILDQFWGSIRFIDRFDLRFDEYWTRSDSYPGFLVLIVCCLRPTDRLQTGNQMEYAILTTTQNEHSEYMRWIRSIKWQINNMLECAGAARLVYSCMEIAVLNFPYTHRVRKNTNSHRNLEPFYNLSRGYASAPESI